MVKELLVRIPEELHEQLRLKSFTEKKSMALIITELLEEVFKREGTYKEPFKSFLDQELKEGGTDE